MKTDSSHYILLGVPLDLGSSNVGSAAGPQTFRDHRIVEKLKGTGVDIQDVGDIAVRNRNGVEPDHSRMHNVAEIIRVSEEVAQRVQDTVQQGHKVIALGGDHAIGLGTFSGASATLHGQLGMIYIDAHPDINTADTTLTGAVHGMHLAALMGFGAPELTHVHTEQTKLAKDNLLHIGASDSDEAELDLIKREHLRTFSLFDLLTHGFGNLWPMIDQLASRVSNIWVSLDLDVIDQTYAPGVSLPNDKGFTYREIATLAEYIGNHCNVIGVDLVEYNPSHDKQRQTAELGIGLIAKLLGRNYSPYTEYLAHHHAQ